MKTSINRRAWFKSAATITSGLVITPALLNELMAGSMNKAEANFQFRKEAIKIRLNSNENPYGPSEKARQAVMQILNEGNRYPFNAIERILAKKESVSPGIRL